MPLSCSAVPQRPSVAFPDRFLWPADVWFIAGAFACHPPLFEAVQQSYIAGNGSCEPTPAAADWDLDQLAEFVACECSDFGVPAVDALQWYFNDLEEARSLTGS